MSKHLFVRVFRCMCWACRKVLGAGRRRTVQSIRVQVALRAGDARVQHISVGRLRGQRTESLQHGRRVHAPLSGRAANLHTLR